MTVIKMTPPIISKFRKLIKYAEQENLVTLTAKQQNGLYVAHIPSVEIQNKLSNASLVLNTVRLSAIPNMIQYFHELWGHPCERVMSNIVTFNSMIGIPKYITTKHIRQYFPHGCKQCACGALSQKPLKNGVKLPRRIALEIGDEVQIDIIGVVDNKEYPLSDSYSGFKYILNAVDLKSDYTMIFLLKNRKGLLHQVENIVLEYKRNKYTIKNFNFDAEFDTETIHKYLKGQGITWNVAPPNEHSFIGTVERKNRTIQESLIKSMSHP
jgi:hypothetical protein